MIKSGVYILPQKFLMQNVTGGGGEEIPKYSYKSQSFFILGNNIDSFGCS